MSTATSYPLIPGFSSHHAILLRKMGWLTGLLRLLRAFRDGTFVPKSTTSNPLIRGFSSRHAILLRKMGWLTGFEPATLGTTSRCSNQLSYSHHLEKICMTLIPKEVAVCFPESATCQQSFESNVCFFYRAAKISCAKTTNAAFTPATKLGACPGVQVSSSAI